MYEIQDVSHEGGWGAAERIAPFAAQRDLALEGPARGEYGEVNRGWCVPLNSHLQGYPVGANSECALRAVPRTSAIAARRGLSVLASHFAVQLEQP